MTKRVSKVGVVGCGNISTVYFENAQKYRPIEIAGCTDLIEERYQAKAQEFGVQAYRSVEDILSNPEIDIILNLTTPEAHAEVAFAAVRAGKSVYNEKPLTIGRDEGRQLLELADSKGVLVGCAPDTFLGGGIQTCRKVIDDGLIGEPIGATAAMMCHGHESWHPDPAFYYKTGGGPMFDMGPYYLTALLNLIGPVRRVTGSARVTFKQRTITSEPKNGTVIDVDVPTHIVGILDFTNGAVGTITTSFDVWGAELPFIEIYGTKGSMSVPDPNTFDGSVRVRREGSDRWEDIPIVPGYEQNGRAIGCADMANSLHTGEPHRASGRLAYHVLDIMHAIHDSSRDGKHIELVSGCERPAALSPGAYL